MENYYHLTKEELSFISSVEAPFISTFSGKCLSTPAVVVISKNSGLVSYVYSLEMFKRNVAAHNVYPELYDYHIKLLF